MALAWFICPYVRRNPGVVPADRYCAMNDFTDQILADGGTWDETEILGAKALVKVSASPALLSTISAAPGFFTIPKRFYNLADSLAGMTSGERNQIENAIRLLGYTQQEIDAAMGSSLALWRQKTLDDLLALIATRRLKPRYDAATDAIVCDGPVQPVKSHRLVAAKVV